MTDTLSSLQIARHCFIQICFVHTMLTGDGLLYICKQYTGVCSFFRLVVLTIGYLVRDAAESTSEN